MIIKTQDSEVESSGVLESDQFDIGSKEMIISLVRENIYKEPLLAFIREIAANARDANREIGFHNVPVKITLPNGFDNSIRIRDCGPGLSPERMKIYRGYGLSTKRDSNLQTGGFGLGAKSPFSYCEEFTISSVTEEDNKKIKRTYVAVKEGTGSTNLVDEVLTKDEQTGVEIAVPIKKFDLYRVKDIVKKLFSFWDVKPEIHPAKELLLESPPEILIDDPLFSLVVKNKLEPSILLDGFHYPLEELNEKKIVPRDKIYLLGASLLLKFDNGEIDLAVSRDNIRYSKLTIESLSKRFEYISSKIRELICEKVSEAPDYLSAMKIRSSLRSCFYGYVCSTSVYQTLDNLFFNILWNKVPVVSSIETQNIGRWCECFVYSKHSKRRNSTSVVIDSNDYRSINSKIFLNYEPFDRKVIKYLFEQDSKISEIRIISLSEVPDNVFFLEEKKKDPTLEVKYNMEILDLLNLEKIEDIKIPLIAKEKSERIVSDSNYENIVGRIFSYSYKKNEYLLDSPQRIKNSIEGIYVLLDGNSTNEILIQEFMGIEFTIKGLPDFIRNFIEDKTIYAFTKTRATHLKKGWVPFGKFLNDILFEKFKDVFELYPEWIEYEAFRSFNWGDGFINLCDKIIAKDDSFEEIKEFTNLISLLRNKSNNYRNFDEVLTKIKREMGIKSQYLNEKFVCYPDKFSFLLKRIQKKYPLLEYLAESSIPGPDIEHVKNYLKSC